MCRGLLTIENTEENYEETSSIPDLMSNSSRSSYSESNNNNNNNIEFFYNDEDYEEDYEDISSSPYLMSNSSSINSYSERNNNNNEIFDNNELMPRQCYNNLRESIILNGTRIDNNNIFIIMFTIMQ
jgi:hypothetical protein